MGYFLLFLFVAAAVFFGARARLKSVRRMVSCAPARSPFNLPEPSGFTAAEISEREERERLLVEAVGGAADWAVDVRYKRRPAGPTRAEAGVDADTDWKRFVVTAPLIIRRYSELTMYYPTGQEPRTIKIIRLVEGPNDYYLKAFCFKRSANRTFAVWNIGPVLTEDGEYFDSGVAWVNSLPEQKGLTQPAPALTPQPSISKPRQGVDVTEDEERHWRLWKADLKLTPIHIGAKTIRVKHVSERHLIIMKPTAILHGKNGYYMEGYCPELADYRIWGVHRISVIITDDDVHFDSFWDWVINRAKIAPAVADKMGIIVPPESERR